METKTKLDLSATQNKHSRVLQLKLSIYKFNECTEMIPITLKLRMSVGLHWEIGYDYSSWCRECIIRWWQLEYHAFVCCCDFKWLFRLMNCVYSDKRHRSGMCFKCIIWHDYDMTEGELGFIFTFSELIQSLAPFSSYRASN